MCSPDCSVLGLAHTRVGNYIQLTAQNMTGKRINSLTSSTRAARNVHTYVARLLIRCWV
ncbi:hypothetical protein M426DRAFT_318518 [Hypoxylon sp. CI-4A]|nr:hypothetical protein M426DRAFT_318518 [Hypoxylon sp. CI-4A]